MQQSGNLQNMTEDMRNKAEELKGKAMGRLRSTGGPLL
jgi:hypothetical protein